MKNTFISKYKLISLLGTGGMSKVYLGQNTKTSNKVAIKILNESLSSDPQYIKRFKREVEISRTLSHPNIIKIISCGTDKGRYYIVYEYIEGLTLDKYIKSKKQSIKEIEEVTLQILKGLSYAHSKNIIHRDIKPSNIMISNGNVKILDFGIARATTKSTITKTGMFMGSPHYTSPEQIDGKKIDHRTDIYSLGIVLYEMVAGKVPFNADTPLGFVRAHLDEPVPVIKKKVPDYFKDIVYKCLEKNPSDRFFSTNEIGKVIKFKFHDDVCHFSLIPEKVIKEHVSEIPSIDSFLLACKKFLTTNDIMARRLLWDIYNRENKTSYWNNTFLIFIPIKTRKRDFSVNLKVFKGNFFRNYNFKKIKELINILINEAFSYPNKTLEFNNYKGIMDWFVPLIYKDCRVDLEFKYIKIYEKIYFLGNKSTRDPIVNDFLS